MTPIYRLRLSYQISPIPISDIPPSGYTWVKNKVCVLLTFSPLALRCRTEAERNRPGPTMGCSLSLEALSRLVRFTPLLSFETISHLIR